MSFFFKNFKEIFNSFKKKEVDSEIIKTVSFLESRISKRDNLNFFKFDKVNIEEKILGILLERGEDVSSERIKLIIDYMSTNNKNKEIKRRFWIQVLMSILLLTFSMWYLQSGETTAELEKLTIGFIGTIIGYWLR